jgi:hypothetical protein
MLRRTESGEPRKKWFIWKEAAGKDEDGARNEKVGKEQRTLRCCERDHWTNGRRSGLLDIVSEDSIAEPVASCRRWTGVALGGGAQLEWSVRKLEGLGPDVRSSEDMSVRVLVHQ